MRQSRSSAPARRPSRSSSPNRNRSTSKSKLLVFNGGFNGGTTTLYIHAYLSAPITGAIVTTVKIKKVHNGRYGLKTVATIPKIAGGSGSVKTFQPEDQQEGRPHREMPRRQAPGQGHRDLHGRHQRLRRNHPHLHRHLRSALGDLGLEHPAGFEKGGLRAALLLALVAPSRRQTPGCASGTRVVQLGVLD